MRVSVGVRGVRSVVATAVAVAALSSGCTATPSGKSAAPPRTTPQTPTTRTPTPTGETGPCRGEQLTVQAKHLPGAQGGRQYDDIIVTNKSQAACSVLGSVKLSITDAAHHAITIPTSVFPGNPGETPGSAAVVVLKPGDSAAETLLYSSDGNPAPGHATCEPAESFFEVTVPGAQTPVSVPASGRGHCPADSITLTNLVAGSSSPPF